MAAKKRPASLDALENQEWTLRHIGLDVDPAALVGQRVKIWWDGDKTAYEGEVKAFNPDTFENEVVYDDGDVKSELLPLEKVLLLRSACASGLPQPSSTQLVSLGALLTAKVDVVEQAALAKKSAGTARSRGLAGLKQAQHIRQVIQDVMAKADEVEGLQGGSQPQLQSPQQQQQQQEEEEAPADVAMWDAADVEDKQEAGPSSTRKGPSRGPRKRQLPEPAVAVAADGAAASGLETGEAAAAVVLPKPPAKRALRAAAGAASLGDEPAAKSAGMRRRGQPAASTAPAAAKAPGRSRGARKAAAAAAPTTKEQEAAAGVPADPAVGPGSDQLAFQQADQSNEVGAASEEANQALSSDAPVPAADAASEPAAKPTRQRRRGQASGSSDPAAFKAPARSRGAKRGAAPVPIEEQETAMGISGQPVESGNDQPADLSNEVGAALLAAEQAPSPDAPVPAAALDPALAPIPAAAAAAAAAGKPAARTASQTSRGKAVLSSEPAAAKPPGRSRGPKKAPAVAAAASVEEQEAVAGPSAEQPVEPEREQPAQQGRKSWDKTGIVLVSPDQASGAALTPAAVLDPTLSPPAAVAASPSDGPAAKPVGPRRRVKAAEESSEAAAQAAPTARSRNRASKKGPADLASAEVGTDEVAAGANDDQPTEPGTNQRAQDKKGMQSKVGAVLMESEHVPSSDAPAAGPSSAGAAASDEPAKSAGPRRRGKAAGSSGPAAPKASARSRGPKRSAAAISVEEREAAAGTPAVQPEPQTQPGAQEAAAVAPEQVPSSDAPAPTAAGAGLAAGSSSGAMAEEHQEAAASTLQLPAATPAAAPAPEALALAQASAMAAGPAVSAPESSAPAGSEPAAGAEAEPSRRTTRGALRKAPGPEAPAVIDLVEASEEQDGAVAHVAATYPALAAPSGAATTGPTPVTDGPPKKRRGRPPGSKNKVRFSPAENVAGPSSAPFPGLSQPVSPPQVLSSNRLKELLKLSAGAVLGSSEGAAIGEQPAPSLTPFAFLAAPVAAGAPAGGEVPAGEGEPAVVAVELTSQQEVFDCYKNNPAMLQWVTGIPDDEEMARFKHWASRLGSVISDVPLPHMPPGSQLVSLKEAMETMLTLQSRPVNMELLQKSGVCRAVAMLRSHRNLRVAQRATQLAHQWRTFASQCLNQADAVLGAGGGKKK